MVDVLVNCTTVLMQLEGGLNEMLGNGNTVTGLMIESAQPRLEMALSFTK